MKLFFKLSNILRNVIFLILFLLVLILGSTYVFRLKSQDQVSIIENRNLSVSEDLEETKFKDITFQDTIENILADQFFRRYDLIQWKFKADLETSKTFFYEAESLILNEIGESGVYRIGSTNQLMTKPLEYDASYEQNFIKRLKEINGFQKKYPEVSMYVYKPLQPHETDLFDVDNGIESYGREYNALFEEYLDVPVDFFEIDTIDDVYDNFYTSDHHWNHLGSYKGYVGIMELMGYDDVLEPEALYCLQDQTFSGTFSSRTGYALPGDEFCYYTFTFPEKMEAELQYEPVDYLSGIEYLQSDDYSDYLYEYHYNNVYPYNEGLLHYNTHDESKKNILIIRDSYAGIISPLIASHFNNSYFINPTVQTWVVYDKLDYDAFLVENDIDVVLFMYTAENYFYDASINFEIDYKEE